jgi:hypothetical protein
MKWVALAVVLFGFVWGLERGWHNPSPDPFAWPLTGYILGLLAVPFVRLGLRLTGFWYLNYDGVGTTLYWGSIVVALYFAGLAGFAHYLGHDDLVQPNLIVAALCWGLGAFIRRASRTSATGTLADHRAELDRPMGPRIGAFIRRVATGTLAVADHLDRPEPDRSGPWDRPIRPRNNASTTSVPNIKP